MGDFSFAYLCITGGSSSSCRSPSHRLHSLHLSSSSSSSSNGGISQWMSSGAPSLQELPLVGQLSLPPLYSYAAVPDDEAMNASDLPHSPENEQQVLDHGFSELPLLWQPSDLQQHHGKESMDCSIWTGLPLDVIERIVAFLHVPDAVRLCIVSKQWKSITSSPNFRKVFSETYNGGSCVLVFQCDQGSNKLQRPWLSAYDLHARKWYCITLSFLPAPPIAPFMNYTVVSASGGLLCLWPEPVKTWKSVGFVVCNPVTRRWKELPCRSQDNHLPDLVVMSVDNQNGTYKILVLTETVMGPSTFVATELYDSRSCKWKLTGLQPTYGGRFKSTVASRGKVYFVYEEAPLRYKIKVFDMDKQQWRPSLPMPTFFFDIPEVIGNPEILDCNGSLLLVGRVGKHSSKEEVIIWELDLSVNQIDSWREVDRMPQDIAREFLGCLVFGHYYCLCDNDQILFIASFKAPMLVYSRVKKAWSWRSWPFFEKYGSRFPIFGFVKVPVLFPPFGFAFDLRFDALV